MVHANSQSETLAGAGAAHLIGIGGAGMRALASMLVESGWRISGSDLQGDIVEQLEGLAATVHVGHRAEQVPSSADLVIHSDAIGADNPERLQAQQLGIETISYAEMLGRISQQHYAVAVAGTHGKSSVTAMAAEILNRAGLDPLVICGAAPRDEVTRSSSSADTISAIGRFGGRRGTGIVGLIEACEYRANFCQLAPDVAVVLNVEPDHFDCYSSLNELIDSFERFLANSPPDGIVIACGDCETSSRLADDSGRRVIRFGLGGDADWCATNIEHTRGRYRFDLVYQRRKLTRVSLSAPGRHSILNGLAAAAIAGTCGVADEHIAHGLSGFRGLKSRLDIRQARDGVAWVDDFAHHPTAVRTTLATLRQMFPRRRIVCVFQPHQASRLAALLDEFAASLHNADSVAVAEVFRAREGAWRPGELRAADLAARLRTGGGNIFVYDEHDPSALVERLADDLQPGDVLATLGAGDLGKYFHQFFERLRIDRATA